MSDNGADRRWASLPADLLKIIGKHLDTRVDVFRFRAVCSSWRSSIPFSFKQSTPIPPFKLPPPFPVEAFLSPVTFCRLESVADDSTSTSPTFLTKVELSVTTGEIQLLIPLSNHNIRQSPGTPPKYLNSLNFRLVELTKGCNFKLKNGLPVLGMNKVVPFSNDGNNFLAIFYEGKLGYWRIGDTDWTLLDELNFNYDDIIVYRGQFYVVDRTGTITWIDSSLNLIQYSPPLYGCGDRKNLVESGGDLYIVDRYFDGERRKWEENQGEELNLSIGVGLSQRVRCRNLPRCRARSVEVKVYKLDEEWGKWVDVKSLGNRVFVIGNECCFSVNADEFKCEGDCVYFTDPYDEDVSGEISGFDARVFLLADRSIAKAVGISQFLLPHLP